MDVIKVRGIEAFGHHGVLEAERTLGQKFEVDLELHADLSIARSSDQLADTIDYTRANNIVREVIEGPSQCLLERLADEIATRIRDELRPGVVIVTVRKPNLPGEETLTDGAQVTITIGR